MLVNLTAPGLLDEVTMRRLAQHMAQEIFPLEQIMTMESVTPAQVEALLDNPKFVEMLREAQKSWEAASNVDQRIRLKAKIMIEMSLEEMYARLHDPKEGLQHKVSLLKEIARFGEVAKEDNHNVNGVGFSVVINLPGRQPERVTGTVINEEAQVIEDAD